jgi:hypothetical protein
VYLYENTEVPVPKFEVAHTNHQSQLHRPCQMPTTVLAEFTWCKITGGSIRGGNREKTRNLSAVRGSQPYVLRTSLRQINHVYATKTRCKEMAEAAAEGNQEAGQAAKEGAEEVPQGSKEA